MLEPATLLLRPWAPAVRKRLAAGSTPPADTVARAVLDRQTGESLGRVYRETGALQAWRRWLGQPVLGVYETDDESLLMTLHRTWGLPPGWEIRDADRHTVGSCLGSVVCNAFGQPVARFTPLGGRAPERILAPGGGELGTWSRTEEGTCLAFCDRVNENPYYKMVLLGTVLALEG